VELGLRGRHRRGYATRHSQGLVVTWVTRQDLRIDENAPSGLAFNSHHHLPADTGQQYQSVPFFYIGADAERAFTGCVEDLLVEAAGGLAQWDGEVPSGRAARHASVQLTDRGHRWRSRTAR
jgi:hypothetical protein